MKKAEGAERPLRFALFGPVRAWLGDVPLELGPGRRRAVLAALLLQANQAVGRERLVEAVWGDPAPAYAVNQLQKYVSALRRILEPGRAARAPSRVLEWSGSGYVLHVDDEDGLDLLAFERDVARGREALAAGDVQGAAAELAQALALWTGPPLADVSSTSLDVERDRLTQLHTAVLEERIEADLRLGHHGRVVPELTRLTAEFPLRERFASLLMLALYRSGRQAEALGVYDRTRSVLSNELGVDPGPELRQRHRQILTDDAALAWAPAAPELAPAAPESAAPTSAPTSAPAPEPVSEEDAAPARRRPEAAEELALRLDDARRLQIKAGDEARAAYVLVFRLLEMVKSLQERVDRLEAERRPALRDELTASRDRLITARRQLALARRERERAEEIRLATRRLAEDRLHDRDTPPEAADSVPDRELPTTGEDFGLVPLYEVDHVLEVSEERLRTQADQLDALTKDLRLPGPARESAADGPTVVRGHLAGEPPPGRVPEKTPPRRPSWLFAGAAALVLALPLTAYDSGTSGLVYDMSSVPADAVSDETGNTATPTYIFDNVGTLPGQWYSGDFWSTFVARVPPPAVEFESRLKTRIVISYLEEDRPNCERDEASSVAWSLTVNGGTEVASGTLSRSEHVSDAAKIDRAVPSSLETITLAVSSTINCGFTVRLERPVLYYKGLWAST